MYLHKVFVESKIRRVASGGPPLFDRSVNPISTKMVTLSPPSTMCPPEFSDLATALNCTCRDNQMSMIFCDEREVRTALQL